MILIFQNTGKDSFWNVLALEMHNCFAGMKRHLHMRPLGANLENIID